MENQPTDETNPADLQFDRAEFGDAAAVSGAGLECTMGGEAITDAYWEVNGAVVCEACQAKAAALHTGGSGLARFIRATLFGVLAGAVGAGIYYGISALTGYEFGLIAILVGFMVGFAVHVGSQQRGGWFYQLLAVVITYGAIVSTYIPLIVEGLQEMPIEEEAVATAVQEVDGEESLHVAGEEPVGLFAEEAEPEASVSPDGPETEALASNQSAEVLAEEAPEPDTEAVPGLGDAEMEEQMAALEAPPIFFWIFVVVLAFVAPFLMGFENILGILIIGFGLWQAWRINRKRPFEVSGPFQVGAEQA